MYFVVAASRLWVPVCVGPGGGVQLCNGLSLDGSLLVLWAARFLAAVKNGLRGRSTLLAISGPSAKSSIHISLLMAWFIPLPVRNIPTPMPLAKSVAKLLRRSPSAARGGGRNNRYGPRDRPAARRRLSSDYESIVSTGLCQPGATARGPFPCDVAIRHIDFRHESSSNRPPNGRMAAPGHPILLRNLKRIRRRRAPPQGAEWLRPLAQSAQAQGAAPATRSIRRLTHVTNTSPNRTRGGWGRVRALQGKRAPSVLEPV